MLTEELVNKVFKDLLEYWDVEEEHYGPTLVENFETEWSTEKWAIVWEGGPLDWGLVMTFGDERIGKKPFEMPKGYFVENIYSWAIGIYKI